jgi:rubredoxin
MKDLFGNDVVSLDGKSKERKSVHAHKVLIALYGAIAGAKCGTCRFFYRKAQGFPKCEVSGLTGHSFNQDWSSTWQACGKYEQNK